MRKIKRNRLIIVLLIVGIAILSSVFVYTNSKSYDDITYLEFIDYLNGGNIDTVYINEDSKFRILLDTGSEFVTDNPRSIDFKEELLLHGVNVVEESNSISNVGVPLVLIGGLIILSIYMMNRGSKQAEKEMSSMSTIEKANPLVSIPAYIILFIKLYGAFLNDIPK